MNKFVLVACSALVITATASPAAVKPLAAIRINNLEDALANAERLATALDAKVPVRMAVMPLGSMMMSPSMAGIDTTRPITIYAGIDDALPDGGTPMTAVRFHVKGDGAEYLESLDQQLPGRIKQSDSVFKYPMGGPGSEGGPGFYVVLKNGQALAGNSLETMKALGNGVPAADLKALDEMGGSLSLSFNAGTLRALLAEQLAKQSKRMEELEAAGDNPDVPGMNVDPKAIMDSYQKMLNQFLGQLDGLMLNLTLSDSITLRIYTRATPGTVFQQIIDELQVPPAMVAGMDLPGAILGGYGTMTGMDRILDVYADWIASIYKAMGPPFSEQADQYRELTMAMQGVYTGGYNFFLLPARSGDSPFQMGGVYEIADPAKAAESMGRMMALQAAQAASLKGETNAAPSEPVVAEYRGMEVTTYKYDFGFDDESGDAMPPAIMGMLSGLDYHVAFKDNLMLYAAGARENLDPIIDQLERSGSVQPMVGGFEDLNTDLYGYMYLNAAGILGMVNQIMQASGKDGAPPIDDLNASLRAASVKEFGGWSLLIRLTESDVKNFATLFKRMAPKRGVPPPPSEEIPEELMAPDLE